MSNSGVSRDANGSVARMHAAIRAEFGRRLFLRIHRWIGLFLGAIIVLVGLSGSILSYRQDIDEFLNASMMRVDVPVNPVYRPLNEIFAAAKEVIPPGAPVERLRMPRHPGAAAVVTYATDGEDLDTYFWEVFVDPYSAKVKGQRVYLHGDDQLSQPFIRILVAFHWTLLLGFTNAYILGSIGIAVFFSVLIGLYLWRPLNGNWRQGLEIKWGATPARVAGAPKSWQGAAVSTCAPRMPSLVRNMRTRVRTQSSRASGKSGSTSGSSSFSLETSRGMRQYPTTR